MGDPESILVGRDLTRTFGVGRGVTMVLRGAGLELGRGQMALLMGPSGSGKSTLLAILSGLLRPTGGTVTALGEDLWRLPDGERKQFRLRHCGFIFQGCNLFASLTARQQLEMVLLWSGQPRQAAVRRAAAMLDLLGLARQAGLRPGQLSGGEKQRVAVGRALVKSPALCFADEPTSALDWEHGRQVVELLRGAAARGTTVLVVSHDARLIPYADRTYYLEDGRMAERRPSFAHTEEVRS
jgi:putative ABC transport system ATP-binding protein